MQRFKEFPTPIKEKYVSLIVTGIIVLIAGICVSLLFKDTTMMVLSILVTAACCGKAYSFYTLAAQKSYETIKGTCISISHIIIRKQKKIKILDEGGNERNFILSRHSKVFIGKDYLFYFKSTRKISLGSEYLDSVLSSDCFLGYEELIESKTTK